MSAVTTMLRSSAAPAIQSSAASKPSDTTTRSTSGCSGTRSRLLLTIFTGTACRHATRYTSSLTGQASASTRMTGAALIPPPRPTAACAERDHQQEDDQIETLGLHPLAHQPGEQGRDDRKRHQQHNQKR